MRLLDLNPTLTAESLSFDCGKCNTHRVWIRVGEKHDPSTAQWAMTGKLENLTVKPSIWIHGHYERHLGITTPCEWHIHVTDGEIVPDPPAR